MKPRPPLGHSAGSRRFVSFASSFPAAFCRARTPVRQRTSGVELVSSPESAKLERESRHQWEKRREEGLALVESIEAPIDAQGDRLDVVRAGEVIEFSITPQKSKRAAIRRLSAGDAALTMTASGVPFRDRLSALA